MQLRPLAATGIDLPVLSFGASSLGNEFRSVSLEDALQSVRVALELGMNFIDTSPFYGRGMSEVLLGIALDGVPRDSYLLGTKVGRYSEKHFDFSAKRIEESIHISLQRLRTDHLDVLLLHDVEFVTLPQIWEEALPALIKAKQQGKARAIGFSCYPLKTFHRVLDQVEDQIDCVLAYNRYTLQNSTLATDLLPRLQARGIGVINAGPFSARLLTSATLPAWLKEPEEVKAAARAAARHCQEHGVDLAQLALQFACDHPGIATCVAGSANPENIRKWSEWLTAPRDAALITEVRELFAPVLDIGHAEGLPENN